MASLTPDPKKRSYLLPPGCKDLHDVLHPPSPAGSAYSRHSFADPHEARAAAKKRLADQGLEQTDHDPCSGTLLDLESHLRKVLDSDAYMWSLWVSTADHRFSLSLHRARTREARLDASLSVEIGTPQETAMDQFCLRHGFPVPEKGPLPSWFRTDLPVSQIYRLDGLPTEPVPLTALLRELMSEVDAIVEATALTYRIDELRKIA